MPPYAKLEEDENLILMNFDTWFKGTSLLLGKRSNEFAAIDAALQTANNSLQSLENSEATLVNLIKLRNSMENWMKTKDKWWESDRNKNKIIEKLYEQVCLLTVKTTDLDAFKFIKSSHEKRLHEMFNGKKFTLKRDKESVFSKLKKAANAITTVKSILENEKEEEITINIGTKNFVNDFQQKFTREIDTISFNFDFNSEMMPIFSALKTIGSLFYESLTPFINLINTVKKSFSDIADMYRLNKIDQLFSPGSASKAFKAVKELQSRHLKSNLINLAISSVHTAINIFTTGATGTIAIFIAKSSKVITESSKFISSVTNYVKDFFKNFVLFKNELHEISNANKIFENSEKYSLISNNSEELFDKCPLAGCYFLAYSDTSSIINLDVTMLGSFKFNERVEKTKIDIRIAIKAAEKYIHESNYEIANLIRKNGSEKEGFFQEFIKNAKNKVTNLYENYKNNKIGYYQLNDLPPR